MVTESKTVIPPKPDYPCNACHHDAWYWPGDYYYGPKRWLCGACHPAPGELSVNPCLTGKRGRLRLNIDFNLICDTLRTEKNIKSAAVKLHCSRGYIYKMVGVERVRRLIEA